MQSENHQFMEFADQVKARYIKNGIQALTGYRLNPRNAVSPNERIHFLLTTPEENVEITPYDEGEPTKVRQVRFSYEDEVLELYTDIEVRSFERMNKLLIENGLLIPYDASAPDLNKSSVLNNTETAQLVKLKTTTLFKEKIDNIKSVYTLESILRALEEYEDAKYTHIKYVKSKINELNSR